MSVWSVWIETLLRRFPH